MIITDFGIMITAFALYCCKTDKENKPFIGFPTRGLDVRYAILGKDCLWDTVSAKHYSRLSHTEMTNLRASVTRLEIGAVGISSIMVCLDKVLHFPRCVELHKSRDI